MGGTRVVMAGRFIDGSGADVRKNVFLTMCNGIITAIGPAPDLPQIAEAAIDDFSHCTIVPALVDCSMSLLRSPSVDRKVRLDAEEADLAKKTTMLARHIYYCHSHGVQGVVNNNDISDVLECYQKEITKGCLIDIRSPCNLCRSKQDCASRDLAYGDFFRIGYSENIEKAKTQSARIRREELCLILQNKDRRENTVVVANGMQQVNDALEVGCDAIEQGYGMGKDNLRKMAEKNVMWIPSVLRVKNAMDGADTGGGGCCRFSLRYETPGKPDPDANVFWKRMLDEQLAQLRFARKLGVTTAVGTGAGGVGILHGESMVDEMKLFIKAGYSLEQTIQCASENGARFFGMENLGTLTVGRKATFLIARGSVKQLPRKLSYLEAIYVDGFPSIAYSKNPIKTV